MRRRSAQTPWILYGAGAVAVIGVIVFAAWAASRATGDSGADAASPCGAHPFEHVYKPSRLKILAKCRTVTGTIDAIKREPDGDLHVRLNVDDVALINQKNIDDQHGDLVIEPVCVNAVTQEDAQDACRDYRSDVVVPAAGTRVSVTGPWVLDSPHGWNEIHPVLRMETIP